MTTPTSRRQRLLDAAEELLEESGPHALSLREIAIRSGYSTQAVYTEFGGKPGLVDALYREGYQRLSETLHAVPASLTSIERIAALSHAYRRTALANPHFYDLMTGHPVPEYEPPAESRRLAAATFNELVGAIAAAIANGHLRASSAQEVAHLLWTVGHGHLSLVLHGLQPDDVATWDLLFDLVIDRFRSGTDRRESIKGG